MPSRALGLRAHSCSCAQIKIRKARRHFVGAGALRFFLAPFAAIIFLREFLHRPFEFGGGQPFIRAKKTPSLPKRRQGAKKVDARMRNRLFIHQFRESGRVACERVFYDFRREHRAGSLFVPAQILEPVAHVLLVVRSLRTPDFIFVRGPISGRVGC